MTLVQTCLLTLRAGSIGGPPVCADASWAPPAASARTRTTVVFLFMVPPSGSVGARRAATKSRVYSSTCACTRSRFLGAAGRFPAADDHPIASGSLGRVERDVGDAQQLVRVLRVFGKHGDPERRRDPSQRFARVAQVERGNRQADVLGPPRGGICADFGQDERELFAAVAAGDVA